MSSKDKLIKKIESIDDLNILKETDRWITSIVDVASSEKYTGKQEPLIIHKNLMRSLPQL